MKLDSYGLPAVRRRVHAVRSGCYKDCLPTGEAHTGWAVRLITLEPKTMTFLTASTLPERLEDVEHLDEVLTRPSEVLTDDMARLDGDILIFGASGPLGQTISRLAKRAAPDKRIVGVDRIVLSDPRAELESWGVETATCDLFDRSNVAALPHLPNVIVATGGSFGTSGDPELAWMMNTYAQAIIAETFADCRMVTISSGSVYAHVSVLSQGATEESETYPVADEYSYSCLARERIYQYSSKMHGTSGRIIRLAYAVEVRRGVMQYLARKVFANEVIDLSFGHVNVIWQGDFASQYLRAFHHCTTPTSPLNVTGPETVSIRDLACALGRIFGKEPQFEGSEVEKIWLENSGEATRLFGYPIVSLSRMTHWTADWVARGMPHSSAPFPGQVTWPIPV